MGAVDMGVRKSFLKLLVILTLTADIQADKATRHLTEALSKLQARVDQLEGELSEHISEKKELHERVQQLDTALQGKQPPSSEYSTTGAIYTRWGRHVCEGDAVQVYNGIMGSHGFRYNGSGSNYLCLDDEPQWANFMDGNQADSPGRGAIYGVEYQGDPDVIFDMDNLVGLTFVDQNVPCSVCEAAGRGMMTRVDGRVTCPVGWTLEYWGYLNSNSINGGRSEYACVDHAPEAINAGSSGQLETSNMYHVEARCGSLACPPYVDNREVTCVVCTK